MRGTNLRSGQVQVLLISKIRTWAGSKGVVLWSLTCLKRASSMRMLMQAEILTLNADFAEYLSATVMSLGNSLYETSDTRREAKETVSLMPETIADARRGLVDALCIGQWVGNVQMFVVFARHVSMEPNQS